MSSASNANEQIPNALRVPHNLVCTQLTLSKYSVDERDWHFTNGVPRCSSTNHHLHLEHVSAGLSGRDDVAEDGKAVESLEYIVIVVAQTQAKR